MRKTQAVLFSLLLLLSFCSQPERQPDEVRVRLAVDPANLNPVNYSELEALQILNLLYNSLLAPDLSYNTLKPSLASTLPEVERTDSLTYFTYQLREEAEWPNGEAVTAADVAFTLKVLKAPYVDNESVKPQVEFIQDIVLYADSPGKFTFVCTGYSPEMELLTGDFFILPSYLLDPEGLLNPLTLQQLSDTVAVAHNNSRIQEFAKRFNTLGSSQSTEQLQGSAGYTLERWAPGQYITLKRKEDWWGTTIGKASEYLTANPARISFQIIPENTTALLALQNRQLDVLDNIPVAEFEQLKQNKTFQQDYALHSPQGYELVYAGINTRQSKLNDRRTRQALAHLFDVGNLIKVTQQSYAIPTVGPVPPDAEEFYHTRLKPYTFDVQQAVALLKSAGWVQSSEGWHRSLNGKREALTLEIIYRAGNTTYEQSALIFQQNAAKAGIPVTVQALESSSLNQRLAAHDFDMFFRAISGNPFVFNFKPLFHTSFAAPGGFNVTGVGTTESDQLLEGINAAETQEEKAQLLKRLQEVLHEEAAFLPLYYRKEKLAVHRRFTNTKISGLRPYYDVSSFLLKK
ncbi:ABC transporter substrate-binding protein [Pontibacter roseus]|uniref:ABC transporter substrate-binding protein n=1 Tax=Pontibacter roseus TaxID=336989 RepID=UPI0003A5A9D0|nr:ABC transporter substrate-binding protein [Pontibacter roseus]